MLLKEFVLAKGVSITSTRVAVNPNLPKSLDEDRAHFLVTLRSGDNIESFYFTLKASANREPRHVEVLGYLRDRATSVEVAPSLEEFVTTFDYDNRAEARRVLESSLIDAQKLTKLFGEVGYAELLWEVQE